MWINKCRSIFQRIAQSSVAKYLMLVLVMLVLFWGIMEADGANVTFVYNNF